MKRSLPMLPPMRCDDGCGECCGLVPASPSEYKAIVKYAKANGIRPQRRGLMCPFYQGGKCSVYEVRPTICVVFGHTEKLNCIRGYNTNVDDAIISRYVRDSMRNEGDAVFLQAALLDFGVVSNMADAFTTIPSSIAQ